MDERDELTRRRFLTTGTAGAREAQPELVRQSRVAARDVFLCHANIDKKSYVRPIAACLADRAVSCWVDEAMFVELSHRVMWFL